MQRLMLRTLEESGTRLRIIRNCWWFLCVEDVMLRLGVNCVRATSSKLLCQLDFLKFRKTLFLPSLFIVIPNYPNMKISLHYLLSSCVSSSCLVKVCLPCSIFVIVHIRLHLRPIQLDLLNNIIAQFHKIDLSLFLIHVKHAALNGMEYPSTSEFP